QPGAARLRRARAGACRLARGPGGAPEGQRRHPSDDPQRGPEGAASGRPHVSRVELVQSDNFLLPLGRALVISLYATTRTLRIYPIENATVQNALRELHRIIARLLDREGALELRLVGDFLFLNDA